MLHCPQHRSDSTKPPVDSCTVGSPAAICSDGNLAAYVNESRIVQAASVHDQLFCRRLEMTLPTSVPRYFSTPGIKPGQGSFFSAPPCLWTRKSGATGTLSLEL